MAAGSRLSVALLFVTLGTTIGAAGAVAEELRPAAIQGAGHFSPMDGQEVAVRGVVSFVDPQGDQKKGRRFFWIEDPEGDGEPATSEGLLVDAPLGGEPQDLAAGDRVAISGKVEERGNPADLPLTVLVAGKIERLERGVRLPPPVTIGRGGRRPPAEVFDDDGLRRFEPATDGIDFWESLEGMRILVPMPKITGPTLERNEMVVVADSGRDATIASQAGGLVLRPGDDNPERIVVSGRLAARLPEVKVGDQLVGDLPGIVDFAFGTYRLLSTATGFSVNAGTPRPEATTLAPAADVLTVATFNLENLSAQDDEARFAQLARQIVGQLKSPDILALQEIQDNSGPADDGVVAADSTLGKLVAAIAAAGGPVYDFRQADPTNNSSGGAPGSNIRPAFLFQPARVNAPMLRPTEEKIAEAAGRKIEKLEFDIRRDGDRVRFTHSPHRFDHAAFEEDKARGFNASRKPLLLQVQFKGHDIYLIGAHLRSKRGDDGLGSRNQPPRYLSEDQRTVQALLLRRLAEQILDLDWQAKVIVLGDMNEHEFRQPLRVLAGARLRDLVETLHPADRYTFNYLGNAQVLDHILVSPELTARAQARIDVLHINSDYPEKERASDHDPLVVRFTFQKWGNEK
jgi:predicted extracellular nuclease